MWAASPVCRRAGPQQFVQRAPAPQALLRPRPPRCPRPAQRRRHPLPLPQRLEAALRGDEEARIRALRAYGADDSLGYFATRRDKAVVFSPSGKAAVTYRVEAGVCLASGDPVGDREAWPHAIEAWLGLARRYAWAPAVMGTSEDGAKAFARAGLGALELGDEAILHVAGFDLDGLRDARHPPSGEPRTAHRRHLPGTPPLQPHRRGDGGDHRQGGRLARHRDRARLLHGAGPARRPRWTATACSSRP